MEFFIKFDKKFDQFFLFAEDSIGFFVFVIEKGINSWIFVSFFSFEFIEKLFFLFLSLENEDFVFGFLLIFIFEYDLFLLFIVEDR